MLQQVSCTWVKCRRSGSCQTCFDAFTALLIIPSWHQLAKTGSWIGALIHGWLFEESDTRRTVTDRGRRLLLLFLWTPESFVCPSESSSGPRKLDQTRRTAALPGNRCWKITRDDLCGTADGPPFFYWCTVLWTPLQKNVFISSNVNEAFWPPRNVGCQPRFRIGSAEWNKCWMTRQK